MWWWWRSYFQVADMAEESINTRDKETFTYVLLLDYGDFFSDDRCAFKTRGAEFNYLSSAKK